MIKNFNHEWKSLFADRVKAARKGIDESQSGMARKAGVSDRLIGLIEKQRLDQKPRPETVVRLALAVGQDPREWLAIVGREISDNQISAIRESVVVFPRAKDIKPAAVIKAELHEELDAKLDGLRQQLDELQSYVRMELKKPTEIEQDLKRNLEPAEDLRRYIDTRIRELRTLLSDTNDRVTQIASWQNDLANRIASANTAAPPGSKRKRGK